MALAGLCSAVSIKLSSSVDDVVWLAPFLTTNVSCRVRAQNACVYVGVSLIQTVFAMVIAYSGDAVVARLTSNSKNAWSTEKILTVVAGVLLTIYTVKLTYDFFFDSGDASEVGKKEEHKEGADDAASDNETCQLASQMEVGERSGVVKIELPTLLTREPVQVTGSKSFLAEKQYATECYQDARLGHTSSSQALEGEHSAEEGAGQDAYGAGKKGTAALFVIAFLGSVDDLTLFVPMLVGKGFSWLQLISGAVIAASAIVTICLFIGLCTPVANFLSSIPLALIVGAFSIVLLVKGLNME